MAKGYVITEEVLEAIESERAYQEAGKGNAASDRASVSVGDGIVLMGAYLDKARNAFAGTHPIGRRNALEILRKVTALGVLTMEHNGAPVRAEFSDRA